jgi:hypothetical protein
MILEECKPFHMDLMDKNLLDSGLQPIHHGLSQSKKLKD